MESIDRIERHLSSQKVSADAFYQVNKLSGLAGTPTILLVDADGVVIRALAGMLAADQEKQVLTIIRQGAI
jgi:thioredoxin-related protein